MGGDMESSPHSSSITMEAQGKQTEPSFNDWARQGKQGNAPAWCLGHPSHPTHEDEMICQKCGSLVAGAHLGDYRVVQVLGRGRNGNAYLASHLRSKQSVVIKLFPPDPACMSLWETVRREVHVTTALRHPSILSVFSCTTWQPETASGSSGSFHELLPSSNTHELYLLTVRPYITGTLTRFAAHYESSHMQTTGHGQRIDLLSYLMQFVQQMAAALSVAHARGIVHGGLIPNNILIDEHERLLIADFGLTRLHPPPVPYLAPELYAVSRASIEAGTMAPLWAASTPACDQYMLAVMCQQLFSRLLRPYDYQHLLPVLQRATHPKPTQRFASIEIFAKELVKHTTTSRAPAATSRLTPQTSSDLYEMPIHPSAHNGHQPPPTQGQRKPFDATRTDPLATPLPQSPINDWEKLGNKLFTRHDYAGAIKAYLRVLDVDAKRATTWLSLGDAYFALKNYVPALRAYDQVVLLNPSESEAWSNKGTILDILGLHQEATECYERAEQLNE